MATKRRLNQKGCGKCKKTRCKHRKQKQRGGCGTCVGGQVGGKKSKRQRGGNVGIIDNSAGFANGATEMLTNVFRAFSTQSPIIVPSF